MLTVGAPSRYWARSVRQFSKRIVAGNGRLEEALLGWCQVPVHGLPDHARVLKINEVAQVIEMKCEIYIELK
jgi:hypothetical protein